jgi:hypothetical protein
MSSKQGIGTAKSSKLEKMILKLFVESRIKRSQDEDKEGWAIPINEAMACGLPVVAWNYSFYHDIYEKRIKYVPFGHFNGFAKSIEKLLTNDKLYMKESHDARECSRPYSWESVARRVRGIESTKWAVCSLMKMIAFIQVVMSTVLANTIL